MKKKQVDKRKRKSILLGFFAALIVLINVAYLTVVYSDNGFISYWREIWIETAMTTKSHQYLATWLFPQDVIDGVMANNVVNQDIIGGLTTPTKEDTNDTFNNLITVNDDILDQKHLYVGGYDIAGNVISVNDIEEGIIISELEGDGYRGKVMIVDDASRVYVGETAYKGVEGMRILDMMDYYGAVAGVNASGFKDYDENGNGGEVVGMSLSRGTYWGEYSYYYSSMVLTTDNRLLVGKLNNWESYGNIRDGIQFSPVLVANGVKQVSGSAGYGIQPRTGVGQRADGAMVFVNVDGRDVTYSIGCTVGEMADILISYGVINACACDSGATSIIGYKGEVITKNCSYVPGNVGRRLPNAFLVAPKCASDTTDTSEGN